MKGLLGSCFPLLFLLPQCGYSEDQKYGYFKIDFKNESPPRFESADPIVFEKKGCSWEKNKDKCELTLELCFIGKKPYQWVSEHSFDACEEAGSTVLSYKLIVKKVESDIKTEKFTQNRAGPNKSLRKHARGNEIHVFAKVFFPIGDPVYMDESSNYQKLEGNLEADHPHHFFASFHKHLDNKTREELWYTQRTLLWVNGTLQLMCEENWYGCWCDQFCYKKATHYKCSDFGKKICKKGFFPERGDLDLCREKDPSTSLCQNYCLFEDDEDDINQKLEELKEKESCDPCGFKTCNYPTAYHLNGTTNTCDKTTCTSPHTIICLGSECIDILSENEKEEDKDAGTNAFFKCKCDENEITSAFYKYHYYCAAKDESSGKVTELPEIL